MNARIRERVVEHIRAFMRERGGVIGFDAWMRLALYAPGLGLLQRRRHQARQQRGFRHGAGDLAACSRAASRGSAPTCCRRPAATCSSSVPAPAAWPPTCSPSWPRSIALPERYSHSRSERRSRRAPARATRRAASASSSARVQWLDRWPERVMRGVVLANEVLDAMPVERFVLRCAARWHRRARARRGARG